MVKRSWEEYTAARSRHVNITQELRSITDGMLLSDASIACGHGRRSASLTLWQHPSRICWLEQMKDELKNRGVESVIDEKTQPKTRFKDGHIAPGGTYNVLRTMSYVEFVSEWERWHSGGPSKSIPKDLLLSPITLRHWFCGDGRGGDSKGTLGFCTDGFTHTDVEFLVFHLYNDLGIGSLKVTNHRGHPQILVGKRDEAVKIGYLIGQDLAECCKYKLQHVRPLQTQGRGRRLPDSLVDDIKSSKWKTTCKEAAETYNVSISKVWTIWGKKL